MNATAYARNRIAPRVGHLCDQYPDVKRPEGVTAADAEAAGRLPNVWEWPAAMTV